jgi:hypothetical protein
MIKNRITQYYSHVRTLAEHYDSISLHINADLDPNTVFESIESGLVNRLPNSETNNLQDRINPQI